MNYTKNQLRLALVACTLGISFYVASCSDPVSKHEAGAEQPKQEEATPSEPKADEPKAETAGNLNNEGIGQYKGVKLDKADAALVTKGKETFDKKCAACHKTTDEKVVGPGLKGVTTRRNHAWVLNMMTNPVEMTQKDPDAKKLFEEHLIQMTNQDVSKDDAMALLNFLYDNDHK